MYADLWPLTIGELAPGAQTGPSTGGPPLAATSRIKSCTIRRRVQTSCQAETRRCVSSPSVTYIEET